MQQRNSTPEITKKFISSLKCYEGIEDKEVFDLFVTQNGFSFNINTIDAYIKNNYIRIFGAGYWRKGNRIYEQENKIY